MIASFQPHLGMTPTAFQGLAPAAWAVAPSLNFDQVTLATPEAAPALDMAAHLSALEGLYGNGNDLPPMMGADLEELSDFLNNALAVNQALGPRKGSQKPDGQGETAGDGSLTVRADERSDGVKATEVTIHESGVWRNRTRGHSYGNSEFDTTYDNGEIGTWYQVTVHWEDGSKTVRDVQLTEPNQTVVIDTPY